MSRRASHSLRNRPSWRAALPTGDPRHGTSFRGRNCPSEVYPLVLHLRVTLTPPHGTGQPPSHRGPSPLASVQRATADDLKGAPVQRLAPTGEPSRQVVGGGLACTRSPTVPPHAFFPSAQLAIVPNHFINDQSSMKGQVPSNANLKVKGPERNLLFWMFLMKLAGDFGRFTGGASRYPVTASLCILPSLQRFPPLVHGQLLPMLLHH